MYSVTINEEYCMPGYISGYRRIAMPVVLVEINDWFKAAGFFYVTHTGDGMTYHFETQEQAMQFALVWG